jgi:hypothetical protein
MSGFDYFILSVIGLFYVNFLFIITFGFPKRIGRGVTRSVYKVGNKAVKLPNGYAGYLPWKLLRGIMANQSEWNQRKTRDDIVKPLWTIFWVVQAYPIAKAPESGQTMWDVAMRLELIEQGYSAEEAHYMAWMWLDDRLLLVDYDRSDEEPRTRLAKLYFWNEDRKYNKWARDGLYDIPPNELD